MLLFINDIEFIDRLYLNHLIDINSKVIDDITIFLEATTDDVRIVAYYGTYHGSIPVRLSFNYHYYPQYFKIIFVADIPFVDNGMPFIVWKDGKFYGLQQAYDYGSLTQTDLIELADNHNATFPWFAEYLKGL